MPEKLKFMRGFSLAEMIITIALVSMLVVIISTLLVSGLKTYRVSRQNADLQDKASRVMRDFEWETRAASKIITAKSDELVFLRYFDLSSPSPSQVRYFITGDKLEIGITGPSGNEPNVTYPLANEKIDLIVENVMNGSTIFSYFNGSGEELAMPVDLTAIRMIDLNVSLDLNPAMPPAPIFESTKVNLRNMKDNL